MQWLLLNQLFVNSECINFVTSVLEEVVSSEAQLVQLLVSGTVSLKTMSFLSHGTVVSSQIEAIGHRLQMPLFRRRMQAPINTVKHYVGQPKANIGLGTALTLEIADVVAAPVNTNREKCSEGSIIKAIHFEYWIVSDAIAGTATQFVMTIEKSPSGVSDPTFADMLNLGGYKNKKNILYTTQGLVTTDNVGSAIPVIRDWLKIPKGKQRMGQEDRMIITFATVDNGLDICGMSTYKEYV